MTARRSQTEIESEFTERNCKLLDEYKNHSTPVKFLCRCGETSTISYKSFKRGSHCMSCSGKKKHTLEQIKKFIKQEGYSLLSNEYKEAFTMMELMCPQGHIYESRWNNFQQGRRCPECATLNSGSTLRKDIEELRQAFSSRGCELLENEYTSNNKQRLKYKCSCGNITCATWANFQGGHKCKRCGTPRGANHHNWIKDRKEARLRKEITTKCFSALRSSMKATKQRKFTKSYKILGYTARELQEHIINHSNWPKVKDKKWHLDHILPIKAFCDYGVTDLSVINCLENLRPLTGRENVKKHAKYNTEEFESWIKTKGYEIIEV
jgi:hypothetical protein